MAGGSPIQAQLIWRAVTPPAADYTAFVHAVDPAGGLITQSDGPPSSGLLSTAEWPAGTEIADTRSFELPADAPCRLKIGLYLLATGERLPLTGSGDRESRAADAPCGE